MITNKDVEYVAGLAKLKIPESEMENLTRQMDGIVEFANKISETPITARIGEKLVGFNILIKKESPSTPDKLKIQAVIVVPMLEPMIILIACESFIIPEFTKPTTITVVAEEL